MSGMQEFSMVLAFAGGLVSFLSPCVLPLVPSYLTFITGVSFEELTRERPAFRRKTSLHSLVFICGFSALFILLGASATYLGQFLAGQRDLIRILGGVLIIFFGLYIGGFINLGLLGREKRVHLQGRPIGYLGSFLVGFTFAAGWTPCVGPILSSILLYASTAEDMGAGILLLAFYSLGLGLPFFISALALNSFLGTFQRIRRYIGLITRVSGFLLILIGFLMLTDSFVFLNEVVGRWFPGLPVW